MLLAAGTVLLVVEESSPTVVAVGMAQRLELWDKVGLNASAPFAVVVVVGSRGADALNGQSHRMTW